MFQKLRLYLGMCKDRKYHIAESEQMKSAKEPLPTTKAGLVIEQDRLSRIENKINDLIMREKKINENICRLVLADEQKNGVFFTGPKITKKDSD